ncbi:MAG: hypothetical protein GY909_09465 [Oligoflexia bacterium]|nr:hypothetical protein [Oligoflexia bacterium]
MFRKLLFTLIGIMACSSVAAMNPVLPSIQDIVEEFRGPLAVKIEELGKSFISKGRDSVIRYTSSEATPCLMRMVPAKESLGVIKYFEDVNEQRTESYEEVHYIGCSNLLSVKEKVSRKGRDLKTLTLEQVGRGFRDFNLSDNEDYFHYQLLNDRNDLVFQLTQRREGENVIFDMKVLGQTFLRGTLNKEKILYRFFPHDINYEREYMGFRSNSVFTPYTIKSIKDHNSGRWDYLGTTGVKLSQNNFLRYLSMSLNKRTLEHLTSIVKYQLWWFPETSFTGGGGQSQRLLNEFKLLLTRLLNNTPTELTLVKNFVRAFIESIEQGRIIDRRPKEE